MVQRAMGELIRALDSPSNRRREWAAERILASYMARDHPFAPAPRGALIANGWVASAPLAAKFSSVPQILPAVVHCTRSA